MSAATTKCELRYLAKKGEFHEFKELNKCRHIRQDNKTYYIHLSDFFTTIFLLFSILILR